MNQSNQRRDDAQLEAKSNKNTRNGIQCQGNTIFLIKEGNTMP